MTQIPTPGIRARSGTRLITVVLLVISLWGMMGCLDSDDESVIIDNPSTDSLVFWPPTMKYARQGDTLIALIKGLKRQAVCAKMIELTRTYVLDTLQNQSIRVRTKFEIPAGSSCASDPSGLDTTFRIIAAPRLGKHFYLIGPNGVVSDSVLFVAPNPREVISVTTIKHRFGDTSITTVGRFSFTDSTASRPKRMVRATSLDACEIMQYAVFERQGDTLHVRVRVLKGSPLPTTDFPECSGAHAESLEVVYNRYKILP